MRFVHDGVWLALIPGFVAIFVAGFVSDLPAIRDTQLLVTYMTMTFFCAALPLIVTHWVLRVLGRRMEITRIYLKPWFLSGVMFTSVASGLLIGIWHNTDVVSGALRSVFGPERIAIVSHNRFINELFGRSYGTGGGNQPMWDGRPHFRARTSSHYTRLVFRAEDRILEGVAEKWSTGSEVTQLYMSPACEITGDDVNVIRGPGVWVNLDNIRQVQFLDDVCSLCATEIQIAAGKPTASDRCPYYKESGMSGELSAGEN